MHRQDLLRQLTEYAASGVYPFHMPGHKRNVQMLSEALPYSADITEIDGFDDLHAPDGVLRDLHIRLAKLFGAQHSFVLVNGSTCGILAGIAAAVRRGDKILTARNCHRSVYNAVELLGLRPAYIQPPTDALTGISGSITPESVQAALSVHTDARLLVLTSPTYDGVISDVAEIVRIAHQNNIPVLVDEAHGAHLAFTKQKNLSAVYAGADIVIHSLHKTLPALTQTAAAHLCGTRISPAVFAQKLSVFESSSPSYILLASAAECVRFLETHAESAFADYENRLIRFSEKCRALENLSVLCKGVDTLENHPTFFAFDGGKLPIVTVRTALDGASILRELRTKYALEGEMAALSYALLMTSVCDTDAGFRRLWEALAAIDGTAETAEKSPVFQTPILPEMHCIPADAAGRGTRQCKLSESVGKISAETVLCYPPGIPSVVPGEVITAEITAEIENARKHGLFVRTSGRNLPYIAVFD